MGYVVGHVVRDRPSRRGRRSRPAARANASRSLVDTMAKIHAVDLDAAGLDDLGRHEGYIARQLQALVRPVASSADARAAGGRPASTMPSRPASPSRAAPRSCTATTGSTTAWSTTTARSIAVLDWEICTLGDPLADVGLLTVYWTGPDDQPGAWSGRRDHRRPVSGPRPARRAVRRGVRPRRVEPRLLRRLRRTGSWPASSRACTRGTSAARSAIATRRRARRSSKSRSRPARPPAGGRQHAGAARMTDGRPPSFVERGRPTSASRSLVVMLTGLDRRRRRRRRGDGGASRPSASATPIATFDDDVYIDFRARRPTMELRDGSTRVLRVARINVQVGRDRRRPRRGVARPDPSPTWPGTASPTPSATWRSSSA